MPRFIDITGKRFGRLISQKYMGTNKHRRALWRCKCDCGSIKIVEAANLKSGGTQSCGCLWREQMMCEHNSNWRGGRKIHSKGYILILKPEHPHANSDGYVFEHVMIAEEILGRKLQKNEVAHHVNGNKGDNRNCNLLICTISYHHWLHHRMAALYAKEKFGGNS